ncbi:MAG: MotA/TolQ/ExbB proton channel family protein [Myxococcales bacterium]|jgi:biopolymer transport protein ExbB|nr:MotA/TolQ/ExbB proton channel family protein [Myxococcales bacterium]
MNQTIEFLTAGGPVMIPIALGSVIALTIFLERMWALRKERIIPDDLVPRVLKLVADNEFGKARDACLASNSPMGRILQTALEARNASREQIKAAVEEKGVLETARMEKFIEALGTTASLEPLLGLLGTVTGMIGVFKKVVASAATGAVDPSQLANGIWQALITTAAGLSVAIPAYVAYRYLVSKNLRRALEMEEAAGSLLDLLAPVGNPETAPPKGAAS